MSDGGKGSSPRPYSVSQEQFGNNYDAIFGKKKKSNCNCRKCLQERGEMLSYSMDSTLVNVPGPNAGFYGMILCEFCGNKRCPHATDHNNACTNSNESGQPGSIYK